MCVIAAHGVHCLVAGCRGSGAGQQAMRPGRGMSPDPRQPATKHCTSWAAITHI